MRNSKLSWVVFVVLGALMYYLRYEGGLNRNHVQQLITIGPYVLLVLHVKLVLMAFQDAIFQGILSLLVPLYSFYWLFLVSDAFLLRAIVAGLCVGIGMDSLAFYQAWFTSLTSGGKTFIESGGGDI